MTKAYNIDWLKEEFEKGNPLKYLFFWGHTSPQDQTVGNWCLSQWFESPFEVNGITYKTTEHWMMSQKALLFDNYDIHQKIIECNKPGEAKDLGRQVTGFDEQVWVSNRYSIVKTGNINKFSQNQELGNYLLNTKDRVLVEASPVDTIWGIGLSKDSEDATNIYSWRGLNLLGFVLMETRDFFREHGFFQIADFQFRTPWNEFPAIDAVDIFWRMGKGEDFIINFFKNYQSLTKSEKVKFQIANPEPKNWRGFFEEIELNH
ncbi:NADAR family protein [Fulvivirga sp. RKSG066]|uniref:NADAR family protein n=1 Tax=Fulvivirga aurantia TaxID=2529383 RepID=UPI0012BCD5C1|nr:NADAR family protein [Fulvivirga aurantia]MTI20725.1 NADAR family protein [Fulvivirga aurantia]